MADERAAGKNSVLPLVVVITALVARAIFIIFLSRPMGWSVAATTLWFALGCSPSVIVRKDGNWSTSKFQLFPYGAEAKSSRFDS
jgi:hypothetical protein